MVYDLPCNSGLISSAVREGNGVSDAVALSIMASVIGTTKTIFAFWSSVLCRSFPLTYAGL